MSILSLVPDITVEIAARMLPEALHANIAANLPLVLNALVTPQLADKPMILMALATIRAETAAFEPVGEGESRYNTSPGGHPFDLYDWRADLGNIGPPDGQRFRGRGFVQLTGRSNYALHGEAIGLGNQLIDNPDLANDSDIAARLLASFLKAREEKIRVALAAHNLAAARKLVNGGTHGLEAFEAAYNAGLPLIPDQIAALPDPQSPLPHNA
ncbi:MAG TPA: glycoside hydrolase family 19 protein [Bryobacteraceae bacterium]|nr:glycoside hydrolase family 19 protein [Bryobacteraceae bacterium]